MWTNEGRYTHIWYRGYVALKHNALAPIHGGSSTKNGTKAESSCTIKSNVVDTEVFIFSFILHWESFM